MVRDKIIKVCGMREAENIREVESLGVDMIGFIFYPKSSRYVVALPDYMPTRAERVGVFVNESQEVVMEMVARFGLHAVQLHGNESPEYCAEMRARGVKVIKAFPVVEVRDLNVTVEYTGTCDLFLFDTKCEQYGGSGAQFDWDILTAYFGITPFLLSGGIDLASSEHLREFHHPQLVGYDLNSRFEVSPAHKSVELLEQFLKNLEK